MIIHPEPKDEHNPKRNLGYLHIYTGEGKGKTSAALGVAVRAVGHGHKVLMIQFLKGQRDSGEVLALQNVPNVEILQFGRTDLTSMDALQSMDSYLAQQALQYARDAVRSRARPDVLILDEILPAIHYKLLSVEDVIDFLDNRHRNTEVILTGRNAHPALLNLADLVTVMQPTKQYFNHSTFTPRFGIEQ